MFSGIVETMAQVVKIETEQTNKHFTLRNPFGEALSIDQSIAHNGVCLTVVKIEGDLYTVTAMQETLRLTNLDLLKVGDYVNVERSMLMGGRLTDTSCRDTWIRKPFVSMPMRPTAVGTTALSTRPPKRWWSVVISAWTKAR